MVVTVKLLAMPTTNVMAPALVIAGARLTVNRKFCAAGEPTPFDAVKVSAKVPPVPVGVPDSVAVLAQAGGHWHDYGKAPRDGRKVGHATMRADSGTDLAKALAAVAQTLERSAQVAPVLARLASH